ncbi:LuxR C-terminal-related transcriptional regulator [Flexivirga oryzae]|uniref:DNA-binding CsgD family transcriptional regulator n=1 Tax=Flexivirga oryzae TaxID=1794944 RepID=A0A839N7B8_9MICO|nr:LuxR family transcriptional regulator [Flexivirga oryzae]MBB2892649.1 DNA-binding CsgD family transcriptional regulator [Flexivirga oryzae]
MAARWPLVGRAEELALVSEALGDPAGRCVVLSGRAGVGKTRLARELADNARGQRWQVRWAIGTEQTREVPLGAVAPLLPGTMPDAGDSDRFRLLGWARRCLTAGGSSRELLVIDDAPLLDDLTAALVQQLVRGGDAVRLLLTARDDDIPAWLAALARDDRVEHVQIQELAEDDVSVLTESVLGGAVDAATLALLWAHSSGNPLWLRQLVAQGTDDGALQRRADVWRWDGPIGGGGLRQLLADRMDRLPEDEQRALQIVAVGEPLPLPVGDELGVGRQIDELAQRSLIEEDGTGRLRMAHPLYGSVVRAALGTLARTTIELRLADAFTRRRLVSGPDVVRVAGWRLEGGDISDKALMVDAAQRALLLDAGLAERFARVAVSGAKPTFESMHVLGRALFDQRRGAEADRVYRRLLRSPLTREERMGVTLETAMSRAWSQHDAATAVRLLVEAEHDPEFAPYVPLIAGMRAAVEVFRGAPNAALDAALDIAQDPDGEVRVRVLASLAVVPALVIAGRVCEAVALVEWARAAAPSQEFSGAVPYGPTYANAQLEWEYAYALRWSGQIGEAVSTATDSLHRAALETARHTQSYGLLNAAVGGASLAAGNVRGALGALRAAASALRESDANGTVVSCLADLARAEALAGNTDFAREVLDEANDRLTPATCIFAASVARARSVVLATAGNLPQARSEAIAGAERARNAGQLVLEAACLHLVARFDDAAAVEERLAILSGATDAGLVALFAAHAAASAGGGAGELRAVAERFAEAGALMLAAQASAEAARAERRAGHAAAANRMAQASRAYSAQCPGAPKPLLLVEPIALTARERNIVDLARRGSTNQEIADLLVVSVRTVESHLQHAYRKLGVAGRSELVAAPEEPG